VFVITADQVDSTQRADIVGRTLESIGEQFGDRLALPPDRNAGDEIQALTPDAATTLDLVLTLTRERAWSVGLGMGGVRTPLPRNTREATGDAFVAARTAVTRAKRTPARFAVEAVLTLLLTLRESRTPAGWELYDLVASGLTQADAAARLGISPQSASDRARAAGLRVELAALPALTRLLARADAAQAEADTPTG